MAEFQEVMREWVRARKAMSSNTDEDVLSVYPLNDYDDAKIIAIEENVMAWAAEHPEPQYPTWAEWLYSQGLMTDVIDGKGGNFLYNLASKPIPADTAQKLGIEPKEVK